mgnify:CR=1 FL=1
MDLPQARQKMQDAIGHLKGELAQIRTGRANAALVSDIQVDVYNTKMMVKELAQITAAEPTVLLIQAWDKSIITNIVGGIAKANVGLNPVVDGDLIRIVIPPLTTERRDQFIKQMNGILEKYHVEIRQIRQEAREYLKSQKESGQVGEDDQKRQEESLQKLHDEFIEVIEVAGKNKEEELRQV